MIASSFIPILESLIISLNVCGESIRIICSFLKNVRYAIAFGSVDISLLTIYTH